MRRILLFSMLILLFQACKSPDVFRYTEIFSNQTWNRFHFIELEVPVDDPDALYDLSLDFIHNTNYPSDHIALNFTVYFSSGGMRSRDYTFRLQNAGQQWTGKKSEDGYLMQLPLISSMQFPEAGTHRIRIENKMSKFDTPGIVSLGFIVRKANQ